MQKEKGSDLLKNKQASYAKGLGLKHLDLCPEETSPDPTMIYFGPFGLLLSPVVCGHYQTSGQGTSHPAQEY